MEGPLNLPVSNHSLHVNHSFLFPSVGMQKLRNSVLGLPQLSLFRISKRHRTRAQHCD
jgi:hypothetical protein